MNFCILVLLFLGGYLGCNESYFFFSFCYYSYSLCYFFSKYFLLFQFVWSFFIFNFLVFWNKKGTCTYFIIESIITLFWFLDLILNWNIIFWFLLRLTKSISLTFLNTWKMLIYILNLLFFLFNFLFILFLRNLSRKRKLIFLLIVVFI